MNRIIAHGVADRRTDTAGLDEDPGHLGPERQALDAGTCEYVVDHLGAEQAVLVVDETGDVKKGNATVGVQRQYTGTAGRIEKAQVAVYLAVLAGAGTH